MDYQIFEKIKKEMQTERILEDTPSVLSRIGKHVFLGQQEK